MEKRFIFGSLSQWNNVSAEDKAVGGKYYDSIVFVENENKGVKIYTHGVEFDTELTSGEVESIINTYLNGKGQGNIEVKYDETNGLVIKENSLDSLTGKSTSTALVQAKAVAGALTNPFSLSLSLTDNNKVAKFTQTFATLDGGTQTAVNAILEAGDNVEFVNTANGLKINTVNTTYSAGTGLTLNGTTFNHTNVIAKNEETESNVTLSSSTKSFEFNQYSYDTEGHITGKVSNTVTLPDTAFSDNNTEYEFSVVKQEGDSGKSEYAVNLIDKDTKAVADTVRLVPGANVGMALNGTKGIEVIATDTKYDLDATVNATKGVDVNLTNQSLATDKDTITFIGGSNVEVALKDGKVEISSAYVNDNTTYTGKNAIVVAQPTEDKTEGEVSLKIDESDIFLSQSANGLKANIEVKYDSATNYIYLEGLGDGKTTGFDASAFVKDSFVESVSYVDEDESGNKGKFLKFVFVVVDQDGVKEFEKTTTTTYVDVTELVNTIYDVEGDAATYSVVEEKVEDNGTVKFTVKNTLGTLTAANGVITVTNGLATTEHIKTAVDNAIDSLDVASTTVGNSGAGTTANDTENDTVKVVDTITYSETDGKISVSATTTEAATKTYVDVKVGAVKHNTVSAYTGDDSEGYVSVNTDTNADGSTNYIVKVSGVNSAISTAIDNLDSDISVLESTVSETEHKHNGQFFTSIEIKDGKLVNDKESKTRVKYIDKAMLTNYQHAGVKYIGITQ